MTSGCIATSKLFWNTIKPYLTSKGCFSEDVIIIEHNGELLKKEEEVTELLNNHYINIVGSSPGKAPDQIGKPSDQKEDINTIKKIINLYENHPSICAIKENFKNNSVFEISKATVGDVNHIIRSLNPKKATGPDLIPPKIVKMTANIIDSHIANIINADLERNCFSEDAKIASVRPIYKKDDRTKIKNYRPVSILNVFSKIYERFLHDVLTPFVNTFLFTFISAYRKTYSSSHILINLIEN